MASTTQNKKAIVDFLWDWAESNGDWSKLLVNKIVSSEGYLSRDERDIIFNYFLQSINVLSGLPPVKLKKPTYIPSKKNIVLESLSATAGVNRLAKNQTVDFGSNVTVIYGENGTGKTGYSRILKTLGFSYDEDKQILSNIFKKSENQAATIKYQTDGSSDSFQWNGTNDNDELKNISVFNSDCVQISLSDRYLIVSPVGFHLFNLVSDELNQLSELLREKIASHPTSIAWIDSLNLGTPQHTFISSLSALSQEKRLTELSGFSSIQSADLTKKQAELSNLNKNLIQNEIQGLRNSISELEELIQSIKDAKGIFTNTAWKAQIECNKKINDLQGKTKVGIKEIAERNGIEFYESDEFTSFIQAAEDYILLIDSGDYPEPEDLCVYCQQPLNAAAKSLLKSYRLILNDTSNQDLSELVEKKNELISQVEEIETNLKFHFLTFGASKNLKALQPKEILEYNSNLSKLKDAFIEGKLTKESTFDFDYSKYIKFLSLKKEELSKKLNDKVKVLSNISEKEKELRRTIDELKDRKFLSTKITSVKTVISNHKYVNALNANSNKFNTNSISRKTTEAREELVQQDFKDKFKEELKALRKSNLEIELNFGTHKGDTKVTQTISKHGLTEILSEGEQKAIALAEFLTELQLDNIKAPVIFDDPVNSLDHKIIDEVAKRLIELSKQRQVVVFTHSILLLHSFIQQSELAHNKQSSVNFKFHRVKENFGVTGVLDEVEEINSYNYYTGKLNILLNSNMDGKDEEKIAAEGYGYLRSAIEMFVERDMLQDTIKRYRKGIAFPSLIRVEGAKIDLHKGRLNDIYEKCCISIAGHSSPEELQSLPNVSQLKTDLAELKKIRNAFLQKN